MIAICCKVPAMPKISIALVLFATLCLLAVSLWRRRGETSAASPFLVITVMAAAQAILVSLRWDFSVVQFKIPQVLLAAALPGATWLAFQAAATGISPLRIHNLLHGLPVLLAAIGLFFLPELIDPVLVGTFLFYGIRFLRLGLSGEPGLGRIPLEGVINMRRAVWLLVISLLGSTLVDVLVFLDFHRGSGAHAAHLIGAGNLVWLLAVGVSIALGSDALDMETADAEPDEPPLCDAEDIKVAETIGGLLTQTGLAHDPALTLSRLARRAGLPMRTVSGAINRVYGRNVSQYINDIRIAEACRLLKETDMSVTQAIYASGFQTKSNFNREFMRVTGMTPRDWRRQAVPGSA